MAERKVWHWKCPKCGHKERVYIDAGVVSHAVKDRGKTVVHKLKMERLEVK